MLNIPQTIDNKRAAIRIIQKHMLYSAGLGFIPFPVLDAAAILGNQTLMIHRLSKLYNISFKEHRVKSFIGTLIGNFGTFGIIKFIPGFGSILGGTTVSVGATAATYALGKLFRQHFDQGGTLLDFDPVKSRKYFLELQEEGVGIAKALKEDKKLAIEENTISETIASHNLAVGNITLSDQPLMTQEDISSTTENKKEKSEADNIEEENQDALLINDVLTEEPSPISPSNKRKFQTSSDTLKIAQTKKELRSYYLKWIFYVLLSITILGAFYYAVTYDSLPAKTTGSVVPPLENVEPSVLEQ